MDSCIWNSGEFTCHAPLLQLFTDFHVGFCYGVVPLTRSLTFLRFSRRHQQLFRPIVALSYSSCLSVRVSEREKVSGRVQTVALPQVFRRRSQPHVQTCHFYVHRRAYTIILIVWNPTRYLFVYRSSDSSCQTDLPFQLFVKSVSSTVTVSYSIFCEKIFCFNFFWYMLIPTLPRWNI